MSRTIHMTRAFASAIAASLLALCALSCVNPADQPETGAMLAPHIHLASGLAASNVASGTMRVSGGNLTSPIVADLAVGQGSFSGSITLPRGDDTYAVEIFLRNHDDRLIGYGKSTLNTRNGWSVTVDVIHTKLPLPSVVLSASPAMCRAGETAIVTITADDSGRIAPIATYLWSTNDDTVWEGSSPTQHTFPVSDSGLVTVVAGVRDSVGNTVSTRLTILFDQAPQRPVLITSATARRPSWAEFNATNNTGSVRLVFRALDPDSASGIDRLIYTVFSGPTMTTLTQRGSTADTAFLLTDLAPSDTVWWKIVVADTMGMAAADSGRFETIPANRGGMKAIPAKNVEFIMGGDPECGNSIMQPSCASFSAKLTYDFWMDSTEVTQGEYTRLTSKKPWLYNTASIDDSTLPATLTTWNDAIYFCNRRSVAEGLDSVYTYIASAPEYLGDEAYSRYTTIVCTDVTIDLTKNGYRLPLEAEWEFACRAGTTTRYFWGDAPLTSDGNEYAWGAGVHPAAQKVPNAFGLYDMVGNVREWCTEWIWTYPSSMFVADNPMGSLDNSPPNARYKTIRGSSSANRASDSYSTPASTRGFRCVRPIR